MLPKGWKREAVKLRGQVQAGRQRSPAFEDGNPTPYLRVANVFDGYIDVSDVLKMPFTASEKARYLLQAGDILLNEGQSLELVGRSAMYEGRPSDCCFQNTLIRFRAAESTHPAYALHRFRLCLYDGTFQNIATKTTSIAHLGVSRFADLELEWPPEEEQKGIVRFLDVWDSAINAAEQLVANSHKQRLALLSRYLASPVVNSEIGERPRVGSIPPSVQAGIPRLSVTPKGWKRIKLGDHLSEVTRPAVLQPDQSYTLVTVKRSRGGVCSRGTLTGEQIKTPTQFRVSAGDFLISKRQIVHGACGLVPPELDGAIVSNEEAVLISDGTLDLKFLRLLSESIYFQQTCFHSSIGVHVEKMIFRTERWLSFKFNIPPLKRQKEIVRVLEVVDTEIDTRRRQVEMLRKEKVALMQQLLTGKRRLKLGAPAQAPDKVAVS